jgi:hypothetical protein
MSAEKLEAVQLAIQRRVAGGDGPPPIVQELQGKLTEIEQTQQKQLETRQLEANKALENEFLALTGDETQFPTLALLDPKEQLRLGYEVIKQYKAAEVEITDIQIAQLLEKQQAALYDRIAAKRGQPQVSSAAGLDNPAIGSTHSNPVGSLSNQHSASAQVVSPSTGAERKQAALILESRHRARRQG